MLAVCLVVSCAALFAAAGAIRADAASTTTTLGYDPAHAPIVFIPGLVGSELACGPADLPPVNLWPGTFVSFVPPKLPTLGMVNVDDGAGGVTSRTTSSADYPLGCGSDAYDGGTAARHEPVVGGPTWCVPEEHDTNPDPVSCAAHASDEYSSFGLAMEQRVAADGRSQMFVSFPWDWRRSPADQVARLQQLLGQVTAETGSRATVVAHSFGNLVYREWSRVASTTGSPSDLVGRFVSVAGPWWGVSTAWTHPAFGQIQPGLDGEALSRFEGLDSTAGVFQSAPGTYWLMPTASFDAEIVAELGGESWLAVPDAGGTGSTWVPPDQVVDAAVAQFTSCPQSAVFPCQVRRLFDLGAAGTPAPGFVTGGVDWVGIVGSGVATDGQICSGCTVFPDGRADGQTGVAAEPGPQAQWSIRAVNGDGNVPYFSAIQGTDPGAPPGDHVPFYFTCGYTHMELVRAGPVLARLVPYLTGDAPLSYDDVFGTRPCDIPAPGPTPAQVPRFTG